MNARTGRIVARRCPEGTLYLHEHGACPVCGGALTPVRIPSRAILVSHTTVRVSPTGEPYRLGVAVAAGGAATLCVVEGRIRGNGRDRVTLELRDGRYHAVGARARVTRRSRAPLSST
jgi:uncharacterized OB-fold protein